MDVLTDCGRTEERRRRRRRRRRERGVTYTHPLYRVSVIEGLDGLTSLCKLDLQNNRLTSLAPMASCRALDGLEELYLSFNGISSLLVSPPAEKRAGVSDCEAPAAEAAAMAPSVAAAASTAAAAAAAAATTTTTALSEGVETVKEVVPGSTPIFHGMGKTLKVLDVSKNRLSTLDGLFCLSVLEDLWVSQSLAGCGL